MAVSKFNIKAVARRRTSMQQCEVYVNNKIVNAAPTDEQVRSINRNCSLRRRESKTLKLDGKQESKANFNKETKHEVLEVEQFLFQPSNNQELILDGPIASDGGGHS